MSLYVFLLALSDNLRQEALARGPAMYYVIDGELLLDVNEQTLSLRNGELGGPELFAPMETFTRLGARATTQTSAVVVTQAAVVEMMRATPGFARKLGPRRAGKRVNA